MVIAILAFCLLVTRCYAFRLNRLSRLNLAALKSEGNSGSNDGVSLAALVNIEDDAKWLGEQICFWLDKEWIEQPVHSKIGGSVSDIYRGLRASSESADLTDVLMEMGTGLEQVSFDDPTGDAYVNAWDVANKVSDLIMLRLDRDLCDCMGDMSIFQGNSVSSSSSIDTEKLMEVASDLSPTFQRYKWLGSYLEGEADPETVKAVLALVLGWRVDATGTSVGFDSDVSAYGWQQECANNDAIPAALCNANDEKMAKRLQADLPEDEEVTDIAIEPLAGMEMYRQMTDPALGATKEDGRRVLVAKWLYVQNFITGEAFPSTQPFVPVNLVEEEEEEEEEE